MNSMSKTINYYYYYYYYWLDQALMMVLGMAKS